ncbi:hypothetical protein [Amphritea sp.]|uniref:hypothetical protein n=1 Tax=Amphritea sp. TaxID=1872502 RepID=UPI0025C5BEDB|nr:hypothetical protein [Amphritea sp.]
MPVTLHFFKRLNDRGPVYVIDRIVSFQGDVIRIVSPPDEGLSEAKRVLEARGFSVEAMANQCAAAEAWEDAMYDR